MRTLVCTQFDLLHIYSVQDASQRGLLECFQELMTDDVPSTSEESQTIKPAPVPPLPAAQSEGKSRSAHKLERLPVDPDFKEEKHFVTVRTKSSKDSTSCQTSGKVVDLNSGSAQATLDFVSAQEPQKPIATLHSSPPPEVMQEQTDRLYQVAPTGWQFDDEDVSDWFADLDHQELLQFEKFDEEGQNCADV